MFHADNVYNHRSKSQQETCAKEQHSLTSVSLIGGVLICSNGNSCRLTYLMTINLHIAVFSSFMMMTGNFGSSAITKLASDVDYFVIYLSSFYAEIDTTVFEGQHRCSYC